MAELLKAFKKIIRYYFRSLGNKSSRIGFLQRFFVKPLSAFSIAAILFGELGLAALATNLRVLIKESDIVNVRADNRIPLIIKGINSSKRDIRSFQLKLENGKLKYSINGRKSTWFNLSGDREISISSRDLRGVWFGKRRYGGELNLSRNVRSIQVVNIVNVEKYLKSVVGSEMPKSWPIEALRAQAVAARTYALNQLNRKDKKYSYDINSNISNQVYLGVEAETNTTRKAVDSTRSLVLVYQGRLIDAVFHSSSGGQTEPSLDVWGKSRPYLVSVSDYDQNSPSYSWEKRILQKELKNYFPKIGGVNAIRILRKTDTDRIKSVKLYGSKGSLIISGKEIRSLLNLKSTLVKFTILNMNKEESLYSTKKLLGTSSLEIPKPPAIENNVLLITGSGAGHGVGMSQWGAKGLAERGASFRRILSHFYKGSLIKYYR